MTATVEHISIRVPWHDTGWIGRVCAAPSNNGSCLALSRIRASRVDTLEDELAGRDWNEASVLPPCVRERAGFMRAEEFTAKIDHPYAKSASRAHAELGSLTLRFPKFSAPCIPFRWMRRDACERIAAEHGIDYQPEREEQADELIPFQSGWVQHGENQRAMLDGFFAPVKAPALAFFYAKRVPLTEQEGRVLIGVGRVLHAGEPTQYGGNNPLGTVAWECMVQHSIRPGFDDGLLLPYHEALAACDTNPDLDPEQFVAFAPDDAWLDFAYASEWVSHDAAITSLVACERALRAAQERLPGSYARQLGWVSDRLGELWKLRGPCPGLGSALQAFGVAHGTLVVRALEPLLTENDDPWVLIDRAMSDPRGIAPGLEQHIGINLARKWQALPSQRRALLKLVSRTLIEAFVERRRTGARHEQTIDWRPLLDAALPAPSAEDPDEQLARTEKVAALQELYASRISVLIGAAGTGKTTLLKVLCDEPSVAGGNILLLAPTGKARVRRWPIQDRRCAQRALEGGGRVCGPGWLRLRVPHRELRRRGLASAGARLRPHRPQGSGQRVRAHDCDHSQPVQAPYP